MTHDTGHTPRIPTEVPGAAKKPRAAAPERAAYPDTTDSRTVDAGSAGVGSAGTGSAGTEATGAARKPDDAPAVAPQRKAPAAAVLPGDDARVEPAPGRRPSATGQTAPAATPLFPDGDHDRLSQRLQHAVSEFVESPRRAVEEAESTFDTVVDGLTHALKEHRRTLAAAGRDGEPGTQTEELRVTLQHYRDLTERLLKV
ncbi:hypothetical protein [Streptomyces sp. NBC_01013]|uniref:hypothetical protein n=1 Tax=Streptomyces sp. NBC_01013 TaxID=2903718 RepID=UPI00386F5015|nr:hypothetical protein OG538_34500 [Streptomyces sp. NBC_01013]